MGNGYADWVHAQNASYRSHGAERWAAGAAEDECVYSSPSTANLTTAKWRLALNVFAHASHLESTIHAVERVPLQGRSKPAQFIPMRFVFANKITRDEKLLLGFDALILSKMLGGDIGIGKIIHGINHVSKRVKTSALINEVHNLTGKVGELLSSKSPPDLVLNRHCAECEFQARCRQKAIETDDLSLLSRMTEKERKKLNGKGIFTVTQLSHTFRPRRRPRRLVEKPEKYHHSLKALAIRESKIHIAGSPELMIDGTPVYLDVEGLPDRGFYYLIGVRVKTTKGVIQHSLWADKSEDEKKIWSDFLEILSAIENPVLVHYGSFETTFIKRMFERYGKLPDGSIPAKAVESSLNILSIIYGQIYFPTFSNGLKEIADQLGFRWSDVAASGLQAIVLRDQWETTQSVDAKQALLTYNSEDCEALELVVRRLVELLDVARLDNEEPSQENVVHTATMRREYPQRFRRNTFSLPELEAINKAAYWDYQRERIYVKSSAGLKKAMNRSTRVNGKQLSPNKVIECQRPSSCPKCCSANFVGHQKMDKTVFDIRFMRHGIKQWITHYKFDRYRCNECGATFHSQERPWTRSKYGSELVAYSIYLNIELRMSQETVDRSLNRLFGFHPAVGRIARTNGFKQKAAQIYQETYNLLIESLCSGQLLHADEGKAV